MAQPVTTEEITYGLLAIGPVFVLVDSAFTGLTAGMLVAAILFSNLFILFPLRYCFPSFSRPLVILLINSAFILVAEILLQAHAYALVEHFGILFPLLAINALVLSFAEQLFTQPSVRMSTVRLLISGLVMLCALVVYGATRELLGNGTLFADLARYTNIAFDGWHLFENSHGITLFNMNAGVFFLVAILCAGLNLLASRAEIEHNESQMP